MSLLPIRARARRIAASSRGGGRVVPCVEELETRDQPSSVPIAVPLLESDGFEPLLNNLSYATGLTPAQLRHAYGVDATLFGSIVGDGEGQTIAIVDAGSQPNIVSDLAAFNAYFGLPAAPSFVQINQAGGTTLPAPIANTYWPLEISLDVEWAHAIAPKANILLVCAATDSFNDIFAAIDTARNFPGTCVVSMSFATAEFSGQDDFDYYFQTPGGHDGVTFVAGSGDNGAYAKNTQNPVVNFPAVSAKVLSVGGTSLTYGSDGTWQSESAWGHTGASGSLGGSGGGISTLVAKPSYQVNVSQSPTYRTLPDVSIVGDPYTGVPVYDTYTFPASSPWLQFAGTSLSAPLWAGLIAIANQGRASIGLSSLDGATGVLPAIYNLPAGDFHDIVTGSNGYNAGPGYDLVTGRGAPIFNLLANDLASNSTAVTPLVAWDTIGQSSYGVQGYGAYYVPSGVTNSLGLTRGSGVSTTGSAQLNAWGGTTWATTSADGINGDQFVTFGFTVSPNHGVSVSTLDLNYRRAGGIAAGPTNGFWQFQVTPPGGSAGAWVDIGDFPNQFPSTGGAAIATMNLSGLPGLQNLAAGSVVKIRLVPYGGNGGAWYVANGFDNDLVIGGLVAATTTTTVSGTPNPIVVGQQSAVVASVTCATTPTGNVTLKDGNVVVASSALTNGSATFNLSGLSVGTHNFTAVYAGNGIYPASTSAVFAQVVAPPPAVTSVAPFIGPTSGGNVVTINGTNFIQISAVTFGGANAASFTVVSSSQIVAIAPAGSSKVDVVVTNSGGSSTTAGTADDYTFAAPALVSVVVNGGNIIARDKFGMTPNLAGQNSVVEQLLVTFNQKTLLDPDAFALANLAGQVSALGLAPSAVDVAVIATPVAETGSLSTGFVQYELTFALGDGVNSFDNAANSGAGNAFTTLKDGFYQLNMTGAKVHALGAAGGDTAADASEKLWTLFAAANPSDVRVTPTLGDGNDTLLVDGLALNDTYSTFGSRNDGVTNSPPYKTAFDWNLDGAVDGVDLSKMYSNFGTIWRM